MMYFLPGHLIIVLGSVLVIDVLIIYRVLMEPRPLPSIVLEAPWRLRL
jgi:hypothetical protein